MRFDATRFCRGGGGQNAGVEGRRHRSGEQRHRLDRRQLRQSHRRQRVRSRRILRALVRTLQVSGSRYYDFPMCTYVRSLAKI